MKSIRLSIRRSSFLLIISTILLTILVYSSFWLYYELKESNKKIADFYKKSEEKQKDIIKREVNNVIQLIEYNLRYVAYDSIEELQDDILDYVSSHRIGYGGYVFINTYNGQALVFDGVRIIGYKDMTNLTDPNGIRLYDTEMNCVKKPDGDFFRYKFKKLDTFSPVEKISYVKGYNDWRWIIGAGIYLDDFEKDIANQKESNRADLLNKLFYFVLILIIQSILIFIIVSYYSKTLRKELSVFISTFRKKRPKELFIDKSNLKIQEFVELADTTNNTIKLFRKKQELLEHDKNAIQDYFNKAEIILIALNKEGHVSMINDKGCKTLEYDREYIIGKQWFQNFIAPADVKQLSNKFAININGGISDNNMDFHVITKSGRQKIISWETSLIFDNEGNIDSMLFSGIDKTGIRSVENSLLESELKYKLLFDKNSDATLLLDSSNTFADCNQSAIELFEVSEKSKLIGKHPAEFSPIKQQNGELSLLKAAEYIESAHRNGHCRFEWVHTSSKKNEFYADVSITSIPINGIDYLFVLIRDITEKKQQAKDLLIAKEKAEQSDKIKGSFLHNMQHEIRTPLNAIIGFSQLLRLQDVSDDEETNSYYDAIMSSGNQLTKTIDDIISFSQLSAGDITVKERTIDVSKVICDIFREEYKNHQKNDISFIINPDKDIISTYLSLDSEKMSLILGHLTDNAFKFTDSGKIEIGYSIYNDRIQLSVTDTGIGIDPKHHDTIFEMFNRISLENSYKLYSGTGLGLSISKEILLHIGGDIKVESKKGKGTKFTFNMPARIETADNLNLSESLSDKTITLVTNKKNTTIKLKEIFKKYNLRIQQIFSGEEAVSYCQNNLPSDLMIIDTDLTGMNAITLTKAIKSFNNNLPIMVVIPGNKEDKIIKEEVLIAGCDNFFYLSENPDSIIIKSWNLIKAANNNTD